jgi:monovalent cation:H+ antiporter-2, CPA2 family
VHDQRFLVDVAIVLGVAFPVLVLGKLLRIPELISYLVTGIAIGPHALRLISDPAQVEAIAEVGVALILFFIGLHVPLERLRTLGKTTFVSGSLQMAFTVAAVVVIGVALGLGVRQAIFYGVLIALGSTAVVMPVLATREETGAPFAGRFLGVSIFQDFAVIPLMLLVPAFASGRGAPPMTTVATRVLLAVVGVVILVLVARWVVPRLFTRIAMLGSREAFTAAAIVLIVATIAIADRLGISAALGAFAAGIVVGDTEFIHEIGGILRPFRDFLSVLFFASIGMLLDPRYVLANPALVIATVLIVIAIKVLAAYPAFRLSSALSRTSIRAAFAVAPIGEFSFLLALEARQHGVLPEAHEQLFISVAVLTLAATPLLVVTGNRIAEQFRGAQETEPETEQKPARAQQIIIIGYGLNGQNVARVLAGTSVPHVIVEEDPRRAQVARRGGSRVLVADASDPDALTAAGIKNALAVVIAISDAEGTRRIVQRCRRMNHEIRIVVRTRYISEVEKLRVLGANEIIPEEFETSLEIVTRLLRILSVPGNIVAAQLRILRDEGYRILRDPALRAAEGRRLSAVLTAGTSQTFLVLPDSKSDGKTLAELAVVDDHVAVPAMLRDGKPISPAPLNEPLQAGDTLFLVGAHEDLLRVLDRME